MKMSDNDYKRGERPLLPEPVRKKVVEMTEEYDYSSHGEAVRQVFQEAGYDV